MNKVRKCAGTILLALLLLLVTVLLIEIFTNPSYKETVAVIEDMFPLIKDDLDTVRIASVGMLNRNRHEGLMDYYSSNPEELERLFYGNQLPENVLGAVNNLFYNDELPMNAVTIGYYGEPYIFPDAPGVLMNHEHYDYVIHYFLSDNPHVDGLVYSSYLGDGYWLCVFRQEQLPMP